MKRRLAAASMFLALSHIAVAAPTASTPVSNSGFTYPASTTVASGDTVVFTVASIHNAVEVTQATYSANQTTALAGGFSVPLGASGYKVSGLTSGTHYYVCTNHVGSSQMKGQIIVQGGTGIHPDIKNLITFDFQIAGAELLTFKMLGESVQISVLDMKGRSVWSTTFRKTDSPNLYWDRKLADGQDIAPGSYFVQSTALDAGQKPIGKIAKAVIQLH